MHETIAPDHDYDLIIVSVNHEQLGPVMEVIGHRAGKATILMFNNIWDDMQTIIEPLPKDQVIWGFPGGGGGFREQTLQGGITKSVFLEAAGTAASKERHRSVVALLEQAGFSLSLQKDMRSWYWEHFILNAAMAAQVFHEGSYHNLYRSAATVKKAVLLMQEMLPLIKARGGKAGISGKAMMYLPAGLTAYGTYKVIGGNNIMGEIMRQMEDSAYISRESLARFPKDVLAWARHAGISLPGLEALEHYF